MTVRKVATNAILLKINYFYQTNLTVEFFGFSPAGPKAKAVRKIASNRAQTRSTQS